MRSLEHPPQDPQEPNDAATSLGLDSNKCFLTLIKYIKMSVAKDISSVSMALLEIREDPDLNITEKLLLAHSLGIYNATSPIICNEPLLRAYTFIDYIHHAITQPLEQTAKELEEGDKSQGAKNVSA